MEEFEYVVKFFQVVGNNCNVLFGCWFCFIGYFDGGSQEECEFFIIEVYYSVSNNYYVKSDIWFYYENCIFCICKFIFWCFGCGFNSVELKIYGLQMVIVVGFKGEEIYMDEYGCVKV